MEYFLNQLKVLLLQSTINIPTYFYEILFLLQWLEKRTFINLVILDKL